MLVTFHTCLLGVFFFAFYTHGPSKDFLYLGCFARKVTCSLLIVRWTRQELLRILTTLLYFAVLLFSLHSEVVLCLFCPSRRLVSADKGLMLASSRIWLVPSCSRAEIGSPCLGQTLHHSLLIFLKGGTSPAFSSIELVFLLFILSLSSFECFPSLNVTIWNDWRHSSIIYSFVRNPLKKMPSRVSAFCSNEAFCVRPISGCCHLPYKMLARRHRTLLIGLII